MVIYNYQIHKKIRDYVVIDLREGFKLHPKYTYVEDSDGLPDFLKTKVLITDATPNEEYKVPVIYLDTVSGPESRMLDFDLLESYPDLSYTNSTYLPVTVNIRIRSLDTIVRDELLDAVYQMLKNHIYELSDNGIGVNQMDFIPESREFIEDRWYYDNGIALKTVSEWVENYTEEGFYVDTVAVVVTPASGTL